MSRALSAQTHWGSLRVPGSWAVRVEGTASSFRDPVPTCPSLLWSVLSDLGNQGVEFLLQSLLNVPTLDLRTDE